MRKMGFLSRTSDAEVSEKVIDYAKHVTETLKRHGLRVHLDDRSEKLPAKIRDAQLQKIPYMLVVGAKEAEAGSVAVRHRAKGDLGARPLAEFVEALQTEAESRAPGNPHPNPKETSYA